MDKKLFSVWYSLFGRVVYNLVEADSAEEAVNLLRDFGRSRFVVRRRS